jgi:hypothetical protein
MYDLIVISTSIGNNICTKANMFQKYSYFDRIDRGQKT